MTSKAWIAAAGAAVLLAGLYVAFRPQAAAPEPEVSGPEPTAGPPAVAGAPLRQEFGLRVADGRLVSAPAALRVLAGTEVTLRVQSDRPDELHVHGYDLSLPLEAGRPALLTFVADRSGRFEIELHAGHLELGALEVLPE